ncbi:MAG: hypothetical protein A4E56_00365 [Pelotomaculum sp. PtaU1.Bin065]|nr:MAG: hypothetical protein A4E56_00365 [Pelotomaculum sp. PtaU1.Bin065]
MRMKPNITELQKLVNDKFGGNKSDFANAIGVNRGQASKVLKDGTCAGSLFFGGLLAYCEREKLDFKKYIFYPGDVKKVNNKETLNATGTNCF